MWLMGSGKRGVIVEPKIRSSRDCQPYGADNRGCPPMSNCSAILERAAFRFELYHRAVELTLLGRSASPVPVTGGCPPAKVVTNMNVIRGYTCVYG
ncbi:unnamed protein product, partial [Iphiclides podalirius]